MKIIKMTKTCSACPAQWEGIFDDGRMFYVRYRWGWLTVSVSPSPTSDIMDAVGGPDLISKQLGEEFDGSLSDAQLLEAITPEMDRLEAPHD